MPNPFYRPDAGRAAGVDELFSAVARRYDLINDLQSFGLHRWWKGQVVRLAAARSRDTAADICCGTGDLAFALARRGVTVIGLDFNGPMLEVAGRRADKVQRRGGATEAVWPVFIRGDAQQMPLASGAFDVVTVGYGLRNLADWEAGLGEMHRIARPGGRLIVLEFGKPENRAWRAIYYAYLKVLVPLLGRICCGNAAAYAYILESLRQYPGQLGVARKMRDLALEDVRVINLLGGIMSINYGRKPPAGSTREKISKTD